ncbi:MAG: glycerol-3-phosphate 1-O-acyltransferase PlsY [Methylococcaceae bacterium]|nr:glycerol-3-phosphate 1-O-acyltransferase PlsY [Methylococcaceae bacterium]
MMWQWLLVPFGYLSGSINSAIPLSRLLKLPDPRTEGSKNPGATNMLRLGGKKAAALTLTGDMLKSLLPMLIGQGLGIDPLLLAATGAAAFLGHLFPAFYGFQGGKGVATAWGVLTGFSWMVGLLLPLTWAVVAKLTRISSVSALVAASLAPIYVWLVTGIAVFAWTALAMTAIMIWSHRTNIQRLLRGEEGRIGR